MDHTLKIEPGDLTAGGPEPSPGAGPRPYAHAVRTLYASALILGWRINESAIVTPMARDLEDQYFNVKDHRAKVLAMRHEHLRQAVADVEAAKDRPEELPIEISNLWDVAEQALEAEQAEPGKLTKFAAAAFQAREVAKWTGKPVVETAVADELDYGRRLEEAAVAAGPIVKAMAGY